MAKGFAEVTQLGCKRSSLKQLMNFKGFLMVMCWCAERCENYLNYRLDVQNYCLINNNMP